MNFFLRIFTGKNVTSFGLKIWEFERQKEIFGSVEFVRSSYELIL